MSGRTPTRGGLGRGRTQQLGRAQQPAAPAAAPHVRDAALDATPGLDPAPVPPGLALASVPPRPVSAPGAPADAVPPVDLAPGVRVFVALPNREGRLLGELLRSGDIGYELSFDPIAPIVVGVFPMRPLPRAQARAATGG